MNKNVNRNLAIQKGLIVEDNYDLYNKIERVYKYLFECILVSSINLNEYNEKIKTSGLDFGIPHPTKEQLISGLPEYLNLEYIYLLNNFFVEKLDIEDINILKEYDLSVGGNISDQLVNIILKTYKDVIKNNYHNGEYTDKVYKVCYSYADPVDFCDNDSLVLKIYYSKNISKMSDEDFIKNMKDKKEYIDSLSNNMINEITNKLNIKCEILVEKIPN